MKKAIFLITLIAASDAIAKDINCDSRAKSEVTTGPCSGSIPPLSDYHTDRGWIEPKVQPTPELKPTIDSSSPNAAPIYDSDLGMDVDLPMFRQRRLEGGM